MLAQDPAPSVLNNFSFSPLTIDVTTHPDTLVVSISANDEDGLQIINVNFRSPSNSDFADGYSWTGFSAGMTSYVGTAELPIAKGVEPGEWRVDRIVLGDMLYNYRYIYTSELDTMGFPTSFSVTSIQDTIPPVLDSLAVFPPVVSVIGDEDTVFMWLAAHDENSGLQNYISARFVSPSGIDDIFFELFPTSGAMSYQYRGFAIIPPYVEDGVWRLDYLSIYDLQGNYRRYTHDDMNTLGFSDTFSVVSENDVEGPVLTAFSFFPTEIEGPDESYSGDSVMVQYAISDDVSGLASIVVTLTSPGVYSDVRSFWTFISGDMNYSGNGSIVMYSFNTGAWYCSVTLRDQDENERVYTQEDLVSLGFPSVLIYGHGGPVFQVTTTGSDFPGTGSADSPFATITRAIESARTGDTVLVADGTYSGLGNTNIQVPTKYYKSIVITSENGPESTIIDCQNQARGFMFECGYADCYDRNTVLSGFTVLNGYNLYNGGGLLFEAFKSSPTISNMVIRNCTAAKGGGIYIRDLSRDQGVESGPVFIDCTIENNQASDLGGGIYISDAQYKPGYMPVFLNCRVANNSTEGKGGGVYVQDASPVFLNGLLANNTAGSGGGIYSQGLVYINEQNETFLTLQNCTIVSNSDTAGVGIRAHNSHNNIRNSIIWGNSLSGQSFDISYSDIEGGVEGIGNFNSNPLLVDPAGGDYTIEPGSPCRDAGNPAVLFNDRDGTRNDMGFTGGAGLWPNFTVLNLGPSGVNDAGLSYRDTVWTLSNFREDTIHISGASFSTQHFRLLEPSFPIIVPPYTTDSLFIRFQPLQTGEIHDSLAVTIAGLGNAFITLSGQGLPASTLFGEVHGVLTKVASPFLILDDVTVKNGDSLIIEPGVEIRFTGRYAIRVYGYLRAAGTESDSILFTCDQVTDSTRGKGIKFFHADENSVLSYCRIEHGLSRMYGFGFRSDFSGGGLYISSTALRVTHCIIINNEARYGGGICITGSSSTPSIIDCVIRSNTGAGIYCVESAPVIDNCIIKSNSEEGLRIDGASPILNNVTLLDNHDRGVYIDNFLGDRSKPVFSRCVISGNSSYSRGGAIACEGDSIEAVFANCTISNNYLKYADQGGGIYAVFDASLLLINSISYHNHPNEIYIHDTYPSRLTIAWSDIEGGSTGILGNTGTLSWLDGNLDSDPGFVDTLRRDYYLQEGSACIDAGTPVFVWDGDTIINYQTGDYTGNAPDLGAHETLRTIVYPGDTDNNGVVEALDVLPIGVFFNQTGSHRSEPGVGWEPLSALEWSRPAATYADVNGDGVIDERDVIGIGVNWGNSHATPQVQFTLDLEDSTMLRGHHPAFRRILNNLSGDSEAVQAMRTLLRQILGIRIPVSYSLSQNYPNPFNPYTTIRFGLPEPQKVTLSIYNILGQEVQVLVADRMFEAGTHIVRLDAGDYSSGIYFYRLQAGAWQACHKMIIIK